MVRFDIGVGLRRSRQLQQTAANAIESACRDLLVGASDVAVTEIYEKSFRVTVTLAPNCTISVNDVISVVYNPDFVVELSSRLHFERPVSFVASSVDILVEGAWIGVSLPPYPLVHLPPALPPVPILPPLSPPSLHPRSYSPSVPSVPSAAPVWISVVVAVTVVFVASVLVAVILWKRQNVTEFVINPIQSTSHVP